MANLFLKYRYSILLCFLCFYKIYASDTITIKSDKLVSIESSLQIFEDKSNKLAFDEIVNQNFIASKSKVPNLGISKSTFWIKVVLLNKSNLDQFLLDLSLPTIDFIKFYFPSINNKYESIEMGEHLPFDNRKYDDPDYLFDLNIKAGESKTYYLKISSNEGIQLPIKITF